MLEAIEADLEVEDEIPPSPERRESPRAKLRRLHAELRHAQGGVRMDLRCARLGMAHCRRIGAELRELRKQFKGKP